MDKAKLKKIGNIALNVVLYLFLALCILSVLVTLLAKRDRDGAAEIFGYQMRVVTSESMAESEYTQIKDEWPIKSIPLSSMVFVKVMPEDEAGREAFYESLDVGDVLTFRYVYTKQVTITHRITDIEKKPTGGYLITLAGDNKSAEDGQLTQLIDTSVPNNTNYVIGEVVGQSYFLGLVLGFLMQPMGMVLVIITPCAAIIIAEAVKIVRVLTADKRKKEREEKAQKERELEELRRRLSELEKENAANGGEKVPEAVGGEKEEETE